MAKLGYVEALEEQNISKTFVINRAVYYAVKRVFDILISIVGCILLLPILLVVKIIYMINKDFHPIIFKQNRIGLNGKEFKFYKIRTMIPDADKALVKLLKEDKDLAKRYKKYKKLENDPRMTKIGKTLRKLSLDEFPQFINIFLGNMSIVGPRPYLPREKKDMKEYYDYVITCKPGLTGYWQTKGRSNTDFETRLKMDKYYVEHKGLKMDFILFFKTFAVVCKRDGAK